MLTLNAPIKLHTTQLLTANTDTFGERIRGNYGLLGAHFTPKDLLFLMTAPPELPEDLGGMTTLVNQQSRVDVRSISMDVVNNVVNRILLDGTEQFTYQDQVYITTVLNRLGITNTAQFMEQVRRLRVENESTVYMTKLYRDEVKRLIEHRNAGEIVPALPLPPRETETQSPQTPDPQVTLCLDILNRLDTARIYETVHAFQHSWAGENTTIRQQELRLSEQLRFSNQVSLTEIKQQLYQQPRLELLHHLNVYEAGLALDPPQDEEAVLSQAAAAALLSAVDSTVVQILNRPQYRQEQWVQIEHALWQVAENSLSRFESYHTQPHILLLQETESKQAWYHYAQELLEYQTLHRTLTPIPGEPQAAASPTAVQPPLPSLIWSRTEEGDEIDQRSYEETLNETLNRLEQRTESAQPPRVAVQTETLRQTILHQQELERQTETEKLRETILRKIQPGAATPSPEATAPAPTVFRTAAEDPAVEEIKEKTLLTQQLQQELRTERERSEHTRERSETITTPAPTSMQPQTRPELPELTAVPSTPQKPVPEIPLIPLTPDEAETQAPDLLVEELRRIDQHNRTILQNIQAKNQQRAPSPLPQPDLRQTMRSALRAMDEPEAMLQELRAAQERRQARTIHPELTDQEAALFEQIQPQERALYEAVLAYQRDPEGAIAKGLLHPAGQAALQAALRTPSPVDPSLALEHPAEDTVQQEVLREQTQSVLERMIHIPGVRQTAVKDPSLLPPAVRIIHKQAAPDVTEELLEQLTEQHRSEIQRTESHQQVTRQTSHQVDIRQTEKNVVAQTTEDLTELVNRTLARQMRTISDQVYRQMEKKLQTERSRRGRL